MTDLAATDPDNPIVQAEIRRAEMWLGKRLSPASIDRRAHEDQQRLKESMIQSGRLAEELKHRGYTARADQLEYTEALLKSFTPLQDSMIPVPGGLTGYSK